MATPTFSLMEMKSWRCKRNENTKGILEHCEIKGEKSN